MTDLGKVEHPTNRQSQKNTSIFAFKNHPEQVLNYSVPIIA
jgi:hypothetical protein